MLTPEEELICANKVVTGDEDAIEELIVKNLRFVVSVAKQYAKAENPLEDLVNEGNIGLMIAAKKFRPDMGFRFISYAVWWIRKVILEYLAKNGRIVRIPANKINDLSKLDKKINKMEQKLGRNLDTQELIKEFGKDELDLLNIIGTYKTDSLDREIHGDEGDSTSLSDLMSDESIFKPADHSIIAENLKSEIARILDTLKHRDKRIMIALFGLDGNSIMNLKEVGDEMGLSRESIRQRKEICLSKLRKGLKNSTIKDYQ